MRKFTYLQCNCQFYSHIEVSVRGHETLNKNLKLILLHIQTVGSRFATVRFTTIHFYDPCLVGPSTVATQASFLCLIRSSSLPGCTFFFFFYSSASSFTLTVIFPPMTTIKKTLEKKKSKQLTLHYFLMSSEPRPEPSSTG